MDDPNRRARDRDRDDAIDLVEAAWAEGQIVDVDRDKRVEQLLQAQTLGEIDLLVRDLQGHRPPPPQPNPTPVPTQSRRSGSMGWIVVPLLVGLVAVGSVVGGVVAAFDGFEQSARSVTDGIEQRGPDPSDPIDVQSARGLHDLALAAKRETGSTRAHRAVIYPTYAVVDLPVDGRPDRTRSYYWNGALRALDHLAVPQGPAFDLRDVEPRLVRRALLAARALVEGPVAAYVVVRSPDEDGAFLWGYASDDAGRSGYVSFDSDGRVVRRMPPAP